MKQYETMYIIDASIDDASRSQLIDELHGVITSHGGSIDKVEEWGLRDFAYPIEKMTKGYYVVVTYTVGADGLNELDRLMRINNDVIRHLTINNDEKAGK